MESSLEYPCIDIWLKQEDRQSRTVDWEISNHVRDARLNTQYTRALSKDLCAYTVSLLWLLDLLKLTPTHFSLPSVFLCPRVNNLEWICKKTV